LVSRVVRTTACTGVLQAVRMAVSLQSLAYVQQ
jgi:hypothetical protein